MQQKERERAGGGGIGVREEGRERGWRAGMNETWEGGEGMGCKGKYCSMDLCRKEE